MNKRPQTITVKDKEYVALKDYLKLEHQVKQIAGRALGFPRYSDNLEKYPLANPTDGVDVGNRSATEMVSLLAEDYYQLLQRPTAQQ